MAEDARLDKDLGLWDVFCVATGAMFSSGFFLLPGLATASAGPSTVLAYVLAGVLILPSMLCMAELSTALPRAGGTYYFLDRSLGPAVGTVGGLGTWLALVLKSAFALIGMGAYLALLPGIGALFDGDAVWVVKGLAVVLAVLFGAVNAVGAKESTRLQGALVVFLLAVLGLFLAQGLWQVFVVLPPGSVREQYTPFLHAEEGVAGLLGTVGLVTVSYAGLTKVASVSEEVRRPARNLPLGMFLSLATATTVYVVGVFVMIALLDPVALRDDYTPVATAARALTSWPPAPVVVVLVIGAALAAFASTGNAGILAASRYPMAMARDGILPAPLARLGRSGTPTPSILLTTAVTVLFIVVLSAEGVAKIGSAFNLLVFALVNLAVVVMRESRIESYDPGFRVPLYPWLPAFGVLVSGWLILEIGGLALAFAGGVILLGFGWYATYARTRTPRRGAIRHVFERLGRRRHEPLQTEFREIIKERGLHEKDPFEALILRATVLEARTSETFDEVLDRVCEILARAYFLEPADLRSRFTSSGRYGGAPLAEGIVLPHFRTHLVRRPELVIVRARNGICVTLPADVQEQADATGSAGEVWALLFLVSPEAEVGPHLRTLAQLASLAEEDGFLDRWRAAGDEHELKEMLLRAECFVVVDVGEHGETEAWVEQRLERLSLPRDVLVGMIRRDGRILEVCGTTVLRRGDRVTLVGPRKALASLK